MAKHTAYLRKVSAPCEGFRRPSRQHLIRRAHRWTSSPRDGAIADDGARSLQLKACSPVLGASDAAGPSLAVVATHRQTKRDSPAPTVLGYCILVSGNRCACSYSSFQLERPDGPILSRGKLPGSPACALELRHPEVDRTRQCAVAGTVEGITMRVGRPAPASARDPVSPRRGR
jgi:hypothetical protein